MTKLFIDSDVILDLLMKRDDYISSAELMTKIVNKEYSGYTSPIVIANIHYIMSKYEDKKKSMHNIRKLRKFLSILTIDEEIIDEAIFSDATDFEDAIQYITSEKNEIDFIITRNKKDYKNSRLPVLNTKEFLRLDLNL